MDLKNGGKFPFIEIRIGKTLFIREFDSNIDPSELVWHRDKEDRYIKVLNESDWYFQLDNQLPHPLTAGTELYIPKDEFHRILKGKTSLKIRLKKFKSYFCPPPLLK